MSKYSVVQTQKVILGDRPPEKEKNWNHPKYIRVREALLSLGYNIVEVCVASHVWHRSTARPALYKPDPEAIRVHGYSGANRDDIWITPYYEFAKLDLDKSAVDIAKDIQYYFGHGNLDW
jgi:hypothetical protein